MSKNVKLAPRGVCGTWKFSTPIVCSDGQTRVVSIEQYGDDGFMAILNLTDDRGVKVPVSNRVLYPTSIKAVRAAATWSVEVPA